jgi:hypothetical protein
VHHENGCLVFVIAQEYKLLIKEAIIQGHLNDKFHFLCLFLLVQQVSMTDFQFQCRTCMPSSKKRKEVLDF